MAISNMTSKCLWFWKNPGCLCNFGKSTSKLAYPYWGTTMVSRNTFQTTGMSLVIILHQSYIIMITTMIFCH